MNVAETRNGHDRFNNLIVLNEQFRISQGEVWSRSRAGFEYVAKLGDGPAEVYAHDDDMFVVRRVEWLTIDGAPCREAVKLGYSWSTMTCVVLDEKNERIRHSVEMAEIDIS